MMWYHANMSTGHKVSRELASHTTVICPNKTTANGSTGLPYSGWIRSSSNSDLLWYLASQERCTREAWLWTLRLYSGLWMGLWGCKPFYPLLSSLLSSLVCHSEIPNLIVSGLVYLHQASRNFNTPKKPVQLLPKTTIEVHIESFSPKQVMLKFMEAGSWKQAVPGCPEGYSQSRWLFAIFWFIPSVTRDRQKCK